MGLDVSQTLCSTLALCRGCFSIQLTWEKSAGRKSWARAALCCSYHLDGGMMLTQLVCPGISTNSHPVLGTD